MAQVTGHPNLVSLIGVVTSGAPLLLVLTFCEHGSLLSYLKRNTGAVSDADELGFCLDIARGMQHLVEHHFVHRDLAARNVLVDSQKTSKVADFGLSRATAVGSSDGSSDEGAEYYRSQSGTFPVRWTSPEAMQIMKFTTASDVWSYGVTLLEIYTGGTKPYPGMRNAEVINRVAAGFRAPKPPQCPTRVYELMLQCWSEAPGDRPGFLEIAAALEAIRAGKIHVTGASVVPQSVGSDDGDEIEYDMPVGHEVVTGVADGDGDYTAPVALETPDDGSRMSSTRGSNGDDDYTAPVALETPGDGSRVSLNSDEDELDYDMPVGYDASARAGSDDYLAIGGPQMPTRAGQSVEHTYSQAKAAPALEQCVSTAPVTPETPNNGSRMSLNRASNGEVNPGRPTSAAERKATANPFRRRMIEQRAVEAKALLSAAPETYSI